MIEKVNPSHPDKVADRIAGAIVDLAYTKNDDCKIAVEVLIGHGVCHVICESSEDILYEEVEEILKRICGNIKLDLVVVPQDIHLANNQKDKVKCGDNGIFRGVPLTNLQKEISRRVRELYNTYPYDGKFVLTDDKFIMCQSNVSTGELKTLYPDAIINPLGDWTGGTSVDAGATNRKLGSDMADSVTGGGLHGKDLSKTDVSVNIYAFRKAQETGKTVNICCAIGDEEVDGISYSEIVNSAREYIKEIGGFEKFAEWGLY